MKKTFWTIAFLLFAIFLFWIYLKFFNTELGSLHVAQYSGTETVVAQTTKKMESGSSSASLASVFQTTASTTVALYYFNTLEDQSLPPEQQANISSLMPVYRILPASQNILVSTINQLIAWNLTAAEIAQWFTTEFPHPKFHLLSANLGPDGVLTLEFSEVPWFTDGGSARMLILSNSIEKTAHQFAGIKRVVFTPNTLFQP